jgi:hypothetical protein
LWMGLVGLFKLVQASLFRRPGQGWGAAQARVQAGELTRVSTGLGNPQALPSALVQACLDRFEHDPSTKGTQKGAGGRRPPPFVEGSRRFLQTCSSALGKAWGLPRRVFKRVKLRRLNTRLGNPQVVNPLEHALGQPQALPRALEQACSDKFEQTSCPAIHKGNPAKGGGRPNAARPFWKASEGRLPLWMGLAGLFKLVQASLFKRLGRGWLGCCTGTCSINPLENAPGQPPSLAQGA